MPPLPTSPSIWTQRETNATRKTSASPRRKIRRAIEEVGLVSGTRREDTGGGMKSDPTTRALLHALDRAFDHASWHGPNLRGALRGITPARAAARPAKGRNSIWELAVHCAYWKYTVRRKLT